MICDHNIDSLILWLCGLGVGPCAATFPTKSKGGVFHLPLLVGNAVLVKLLSCFLIHLVIEE